MIRSVLTSVNSYVATFTYQLLKSYRRLNFCFFFLDLNNS